MCNNRQLKELNSEGLLATDQEEMEAFFKRVQWLKSPGEIVKQLQLPLKNIEFNCNENLQSWYQKCDFNPQWIYCYAANSKLMPWEGAATWIFKEENIFSFPVLQFREQFVKHQKYLGMEFAEVFLHEVIHAVRMPLSSVQFEEIIAYYTSKKRWRKFWGPIIQHPYESILYVSIWGVSLISNFIYSVLGNTFFFYFFISSICLLSAVSIFAIIRLFRYHRIFQKTLQKISKLWLEIDPFAIVLRLTDQEIQYFSCSTLVQIKQYVKDQVKKSLRWKQINFSYIISEDI